MKKIFALLVFSISLFVISCDKQNDKAPDQPPQTVQDFISGSQNCVCEPFVDLYYWKKQYVYIMSCKGPACNCAVSYLTEKGEPLQLPTDYRFDAFKADAKFERNVWTCGK